MNGLMHKFFHGETKIDFLGKRRIWFAISTVLVLASLLLLPLRPSDTPCGGFFSGLTCGIEFKGGVSLTVDIPDDGPLGDVSELDVIARVEEAAASVGAADPRVQVATDDEGRTVIVQTGELEDTQQQDQLVDAVVNATGAENAQDIEQISSTWGGEITSKAIQALIVFIVVVSIFLTIRFEWKMALASMVAMFHDLVITAGIYALIGFEVTPSTVIAILTILGYSLYDNVVVFDKVEEDTTLLAATGKMTYQDAANRAMNEVFMRSLNTALSTLLPVATLLFVGAGLLGATTLKDLALALFIGLFAGAYSSMFVATPILALLKEREPKFRNVREKLERDRRKAGATLAPPRPALADGPTDEAAPAPVAASSRPASTPVTNRARAGTKKASRRRRRR
jgi:preprotein translocase subunit SecF